MVSGGEDWRPKVTAMVPCYKSAGFVGLTLDCLAAQTWPDLEILIGDDHSPDDTLAVVRAFAAGRPNVRVLTREANLGWLRNSNDLMARATGELMFFAFHDDRLRSRLCREAGSRAAPPARGQSWPSATWN